MGTPFEGLIPARTTGHTRWFLEQMDRRRGVALQVPGGYEAYVRVMHTLQTGERWSAVAPQYLASGDDDYVYPFPNALESAHGDMGSDVVDAITPVLAAATSTPDCHFALWYGWGELNRGGGPHSVVAGRGPVGRFRTRRLRRAAARDLDDLYAPVYAFVAACAVYRWWGGRGMLLFDGPIDAVRSIGTPSPFGDHPLDRRSPQWWWPEDQAWFVGNEIDDPWSYVAGSEALITGLEETGIECVRIRHSARW